VAEIPDEQPMRAPLMQYVYRHPAPAQSGVNKRCPPLDQPEGTLNPHLKGNCISTIPQLVPEEQLGS